MTSTSFDVVIVGAGAAGSAAACALAPTTSVLLVQSGRPSRHGGENLPGAARRALASIGCWERFEAAGHLGAPLKISRWGSSTAACVDAIGDPDGAGWLVDRDRFEDDLRCDAQRRGASLRMPSRVRQVDRRPGRWSLTLDGSRTVSAAVLINAAGRHFPLLRPHGQRRRVVDRLACTYQVMRQPTGEDGTTYVESTRSGWWHTAPLHGDRRLVAFYGDTDSGALTSAFRAGPVAAAACSPSMAEAIGPVTADEGLPPRICSAAGQAQTAAGDGWLAAGDAVTCLDPLSSQGLLNALVTGIRAAHAANRMLAGDDAAGRSYAAEVGDVWTAYQRHLHAMYGLERRWPDQDFWSRRQPAASMSTSRRPSSRTAVESSHER